MYGALTSVESSCRPNSTNTNRSELGHEPDSEDDQSLRTMIVCINLSYKYYSIYASLPNANFLFFMLIDI